MVIVGYEGFELVRGEFNSGRDGYAIHTHGAVLGLWVITVSGGAFLRRLLLAWVVWNETIRSGALQSL